MAIAVLLTLDLKSADSRQRDAFNEEMRKNNWKKLGTTTTWTASFQAGVAASGAIDTARHEVSLAAGVARIYSYDFAAHAGEGPVTVFSV